MRVLTQYERYRYKQYEIIMQCISVRYVFNLDRHYYVWSLQSRSQKMSWILHHLPSTGLLYIIIIYFKLLQNSFPFDCISCIRQHYYGYLYNYSRDEYTRSPLVIFQYKIKTPFPPHGYYITTNLYQAQLRADCIVCGIPCLHNISIYNIPSKTTMMILSIVNHLPVGIIVTYRHLSCSVVKSYATNNFILYSIQVLVYAPRQI